MTGIPMQPKGEPLTFDRANIKSAKADFVKQEVTLTLTVPLDQDTLALRQRLADLASIDEFPVSVAIQPLQLRLGQ